MNAIVLQAPWYAGGLRWLARLLSAAADRLDHVRPAPALEHITDTDPALASQDLYFDSDIYLANLRNWVHRHYY